MNRIPELNPSRLTVLLSHLSNSSTNTTRTTTPGYNNNMWTKELSAAEN